MSRLERRRRPVWLAAMVIGLLGGAARGAPPTVRALSSDGKETPSHSATSKESEKVAKQAVTTAVQATDPETVVPDAGGTPPAGSPEQDESFLDLPLEQLTQLDVRVPVPPVFDTEVTTVARTPTRVTRTPAAVYVITQEDIRRSGVRSLPDALRMAPGVQVAQIDTNTFAISIRGFNDQYSNKLLVLIDGRSIYTPTFSGVYWDLRDVLLEDVERIEVIRGPGSTIWGSNAVNGIINIITYSAKDTQQIYAGGGAGNTELSFGEGRIGGKIGSDTFYRVYAKYFDRDDSVLLDGGKNSDGWENVRGGLRLDREFSEEDSFTFQAEMFKGESGGLLDLPQLTPPYNIVSNQPSTYTGGHVLARWMHKYSDEADWSAQFYYDRTDIVQVNIAEIRDIFDFDFVNRFPLGRRQEITWGAGYRFTPDQERGTFGLNFTPEDRFLNFVSTFIQDEFKLIEDRLSWFLGSKLEYNDFTGVVIQPGTRLLWTPDERQTIWASVTRAVRIPSRAEDDITIVQSVVPAGQLDPAQFGNLPADLPVSFNLVGSRGFQSEDLLALELGYRVSPTDQLGIDVTPFLNFYDNLRTFDPVPPYFSATPLPLHLIVPSRAQNLMYGETYGTEVATTWDATEYWKLRGSYSWLDMQLHARSTSAQSQAEQIEGESPNNQFTVRSFLALTSRLDLDTSVYYVDNLPALNVPNYVRVDMRVGWRPTDSLELILGVQNMFDPEHQEYAPTVFTSATSVLERSIYGMVKWRF
ncbi:MAG: TonB-dependent receptor [Planctomycetota bacterium]